MMHRKNKQKKTTVSKTYRKSDTMLLYCVYKNKGNWENKQTKKKPKTKKKQKTNSPLPLPCPGLFCIQCCDERTEAPSFSLVFGIDHSCHGTLVDGILALGDERENRNECARPLASDASAGQRHAVNSGHHQFLPYKLHFPHAEPLFLWHFQRTPHLSRKLSTDLKQDLSHDNLEPWRKCARWPIVVRIPQKYL